MKLEQLIYSQTLTILNVGCIELNYSTFNFNDMSPTYFVDVVFTNIVLFLISASLMKKEIKTSSRIYTSVIICGFIYYMYNYKFTVECNLLSLDFTLYFYTFTYVATLTYKYLISDYFPKNNFHYMVMFILFLYLLVIKFLSSDILALKLDEVLQHGVLGVVYLSVFYIITNIVCNEIGVIKYIFLFTPFPILTLMIDLYRLRFSDIIMLCSTFWEYKGYLFIYLLLSICRFTGTIIFIQKYGVVMASLLQVNNYIIFRIYRILVQEGYYLNGLSNPKNIQEVMFLLFTYITYNLSALKKDNRQEDTTYEQEQ